MEDNNGEEQIMLSEEEKKAIEIFTDLINYLEKWNKNLTVVPDDKKYYEILLNIITKLQKEVEHQKEKRENQKVELAILNEKQKEMNKLINTVKSYKGQFERQEKEIKKLQKENEHWKNGFERELEDNRKNTCELLKQDLVIREKEKQITELIKYINKNNYVDSEECQFQYDFKIKKCIEKGNCEDCIKQYFKKLAKEEGE